MPIALDPSETYAISLDSDSREAPEGAGVALSPPHADAPQFVFRYLTLKEWRRGIELEDIANREAQEVIENLLELLRLALVGWKNIKGRDGADIRFDPARLDDVVTLGEAWELFFLSRRYVRIGAEEKKGSGSPSPTPMAESAQEKAPATPNDARTGRASNPRQ